MAFTRFSLFFSTLFFLLTPLAPAAQNSTAHKPGQFIVQFSHETALAKTLSHLRYYKGIATGLNPEEQLSADPPIWLLESDPSQVPDKLMLEQLKSLPDVVLAQHNHYLKARHTFPDDPLFPQQWPWHNNGDNGGLSDADVDAPEAWEWSSGSVTPHGDTIVVAVIDDGLRINHPDLAPNLWRNHGEIPNNHLDDDDNGYIDDYFGWNTALSNGHINLGFHGTQVAGILAARGNNGIGIAGMAQARIMPIYCGGGLESEAIRAYAYALNQRQAYNQSNGQRGAFIVAANSSWGADGLTPEEAPVWCSFYSYLGQAGILNVAATANQNWNIDVVGDMPTSCPSDFLLTVTASTSRDQRGNAAYGPVHIDLAAPGIEALTTSPGAGYSIVSGTSYASPLVAGIVALLYAAPCPGLSTLARTHPAQAALLVKQMILEGVDTLPQFHAELASGGRANARKSINRLLAYCESCPPLEPPGILAAGDDSFLLSWQPNSSASLFWRRQGGSSWTALGQEQPPFLLDELLPCQPYEFMIEAFCQNGESWPALTLAETSGCCEPLYPAELLEVTSKTVTIGWIPPDEAAQSRIELWPQEESHALATDANHHYTFTGLEPCQDYQAVLISACPNGLRDTLLLPFRTKGCGACTSLPYCTSSAKPAGTEWIETFSIGNFSNTSGTDDGFGDFTHLPIRLQAGQTYPFSIEPGFAYLSFPEHYRLWADLDQDGHFDGAGELLYETSFGIEGTVTGTITFPETAGTGPIRLRLSMKWAGNGNMPPQPCEAEIEFGEVEDYCIALDACTDGCLSAGLDANCFSEVGLFPNPFRGNFQLEWGCPPAQTVEALLFNSWGQMVFRQSIRAGSSEASITPPPGLPPGLYLLLLKSPEQSLFRSIVKTAEN